MPSSMVYYPLHSGYSHRPRHQVIVGVSLHCCFWRQTLRLLLFRGNLWHQYLHLRQSGCGAISGTACFSGVHECCSSPVVVGMDICTCSNQDADNLCEARFSSEHECCFSRGLVYGIDIRPIINQCPQLQSTHLIERQVLNQQGPLGPKTLWGYKAR